jgi:hypothetical protein
MTRIELAATLIALACAGAVVVRLGGRTTRPYASATDADRARFANSVASNEFTWRRQAEQDFPSDQWSQRDAFHGSEAQRIRDLASGANVPYEAVIRAVDEDLHRSVRPNVERSAQAVPCKPRPFYD